MKTKLNQMQQQRKNTGAGYALVILCLAVTLRRGQIALRDGK